MAVRTVAALSHVTSGGKAGFRGDWGTSSSDIARKLNKVYEDQMNLLHYVWEHAAATTFADGRRSEEPSSARRDAAARHHDDGHGPAWFTTGWWPRRTVRKQEWVFS